MSNAIEPQIAERAMVWINGNYDKATKKEVKRLMDEDPQELKESFYQNLEFGTGGLRGIMGVGTNRMNIYTVGMATQGLANYIKAQFGSEAELKVAIAHDSRNNSRLFAETTAKIFAANGLTAYLFESLRPTPELSFTIRELGCKAGVVVTASHNPKEYNGYKVYWSDGAQIIAPHDKNIIAEVNKISGVDEVKFEGGNGRIEIIGEEIDRRYIDKLATLSLSPEIIAKHADLKIVYTPIHGTGLMLVPRTLERFGFRNIIRIPEQDIIDGNFPTVKSPNPEENSTLEMAIAKAKAEDADIVLATDPDADRVGVAVKTADGSFELLNGNQTASLLFFYVLNRWKENGLLKGKEYIVKTIVTTDLLSEIAQSFGVEVYNVLTGFKYIADIIGKNEGKKRFIVGGEESYGYLAGEFVRDKDAVIACALIAETAAWAKEQGKTLDQLLKEIYVKFGFFKESLLSVTKKGISGQEEIKKMMADFRSTPPQTIAGSKVMLIHDYKTGETFDTLSELRYEIALPKSDVLQFITQDGTIVSVRPSGTEPKIKFYFGVKGSLASVADYGKANAELDAKIEQIVADLKLK
ncbi:phospho-sugar mutase [Acetobacteroides hydrogenigenes]|uniref:Phosphoglucomutase n=1 Tax=Acetobacteroides hydrogenigenes TaxID=979970 RepID=A0A4R2ESI5_9BACT|nr:phospho-sugar mutase [Acetobacteroides hydrogenigenes]TCN70586.1 phosphoglucomutase [Acetobacteroides hydrogenigenes]